MGFLFGKKGGKHDGAHVIFIIGSAKATCTILLPTKEGAPKIFFSHDVVIQHDDTTRHEVYVRDMFRAVEQLMQYAREYLVSVKWDRAIHDVSFMLGSHLCTARTHLLSQYEQKPVAVSPRMIQKLIERAESEETEEERKMRRQKYITDSVVIEKQVMDIRLNGYSTAHPFGKRAMKIQAVLYVGKMSRKVKQTLLTRAEQYFEGVRASCYSEALSMYTTIRDRYAKTDDFLVIQVGQEVSDVSVVRDGIFEQIVSFPVGEDTLTRTIARARGGTKHEAFSLLCMSAQKNNALDPASKEYTLVQKTGELWKKEFTQALTRAHDAMLYPKDIFLLALPEVAPCFEEYIKTAIINKNPYPFRVVTLTADVTEYLIQSERESVVDAETALQVYRATLARTQSVPLPEEGAMVK